MIHNRPIFHCQCCGAVITQEAFRLPPFCCGHEMVKAAEETLYDGLTQGMEIEPGMTEPRLAPRWTTADHEHA